MCFVIVTKEKRKTLTIREVDPCFSLKRTASNCGRNSRTTIPKEARLRYSAYARTSSGWGEAGASDAARLTSRNMRSDPFRSVPIRSDPIFSDDASSPGRVNDFREYV